MTLRPIRPEDEPFLLRVYASTRAEEMAIVPWTDAEKDAFLRMQFAAQHRHYQQHFAAAAFEVLLRDGVPIGRLYVDRSRDEIHIIDIALLPEHRRAGLGTAILRELLDEAARASKSVRIYVEHANPARRLYERLGFTVIDDTGVYVLMEWSPG